MSLGVWTDGEEWVVADGLEDVRAVLREQYGGAEPEAFEDGSAWRMLPEDKVLVIRDDDTPDGTERRTSRTCADWVTQNGRGYLGGANW